MNVALGEFRGSSYNTNFLSNKNLLSMFKFLSSCSNIFDMQSANTISVSVRNLQRFYQIQINVDGC